MKFPSISYTSLSLKPLPRSFYEKNTVSTAQDLLGKFIIRIINNQLLVALIVETEAYICDDAACHAYRGKTISNKALFGPVGHAYIYFIYGNHYCFNVVSHTQEQIAGGVLIRAVQPLQGIEYMQKNRTVSSIIQLTNGPGKLTQALNITKKFYGQDLTKKGPLYISQGIMIDSQYIKSCPRIGISKAQDKPWRFYVVDNPFVSKKCGL